MPGSDSRASLRAHGSASFRWRSEGSAAWRVGASSRTEAERFADSEANAPAVMLKFVIRSLSAPSVEASFANRSRWARIRSDRSCGCRPRNAWLTIALVRPALPP